MKGFWMGAVVGAAVAGAGLILWLSVEAVGASGSVAALLERKHGTPRARATIHSILGAPLSASEVEILDHLPIEEADTLRQVAEYVRMTCITSCNFRDDQTVAVLVNRYFWDGRGWGNVRGADGLIKYPTWMPNYAKKDWTVLVHSAIFGAGSEGRIEVRASDNRELFCSFDAADGYVCTDAGARGDPSPDPRIKAAD